MQMMAATSFPPLPSLPLLEQLPLSKEGDEFAFAFAADDPALLAFFEEYGYVVVKDLFTPAECLANREAMWEVLEAANPGMSRGDPLSWAKLRTKGQYGLSQRGPCFHPVLVQNRQNPALAAVLALLCGCTPEEVLVSQDRFTVYRATQTDGSGEEVQGVYSTGPANLHLDLNPWWHLSDFNGVAEGVQTLRYADPQDFIKENNLVVSAFGRTVQAVLNFEDNASEDGGTLIVPCFARHLPAWAEAHAHLNNRPLPWHTFAADEEVRLLRHAHRVPLRAGAALLWDQRTAHGTSPNRSSRCRHAAYLRAGRRSSMFPGAAGHERLLRRARALSEQLMGDRQVVVSELGRRLFGLDVLN